MEQSFEGVPRDDAVMKALASHLCCQCSIPGVDAICGMSLFILLLGFFSDFPSSKKKHCACTTVIPIYLVIHREGAAPREANFTLAVCTVNRKVVDYNEQKFLEEVIKKTSPLQLIMREYSAAIGLMSSGNKKGTTFIFI